MKITNNVLATTIMAANTEALAIGAKCGLTLETMLQVMKTTMGNNAQLYVAMPKKAFNGDDSPGFMIKLAGKDVRLAVELARKQGFEPLVAAGAQATLDRAAKMGLAERTRPRCCSCVRRSSASRYDRRRRSIKCRPAEMTNGCRQPGAGGTPSSG